MIAVQSGEIPDEKNLEYVIAPFHNRRNTMHRGGSKPYTTKNGELHTYKPKQKSRGKVAKIVRYVDTAMKLEGEVNEPDRSSTFSQTD
jgi:hypothetical protein